MPPVASCTVSPISVIATGRCWLKGDRGSRGSGLTANTGYSAIY